MIIRLVLVGAFTIGLTACATTGAADMTATTSAPAFERSEAEFQRDREAILAMAGEYDVVFDFREVVALQAGYEFADDKRTGAWEVVRVIEDRGDFISLQHFLNQRRRRCHGHQALASGLGIPARPHDGLSGP